MRTSPFAPLFAALPLLAGIACAVPAPAPQQSGEPQRSLPRSVRHETREECEQREGHECVRGCPIGMASSRDGLCVDYYELPNGAGRTPATGLSLQAAAAACAANGKRLCSVEEWTAACLGTRVEQCNVAPQRTPTAAREWRHCRSSTNVFATIGNADEWTSTIIDAQPVMMSVDCATPHPIAPNASTTRLGGRCCSSPGWRPR